MSLRQEGGPFHTADFKANQFNSTERALESEKERFKGKLATLWVGTPLLFKLDIYTDKLFELAAQQDAVVAKWKEDAKRLPHEDSRAWEYDEQANTIAYEQGSRTEEYDAHDVEAEAQVSPRIQFAPPKTNGDWISSLQTGEKFLNNFLTIAPNFSTLVNTNGKTSVDEYIDNIEYRLKVIERNMQHIDKASKESDKSDTEERSLKAAA